MTDPRATNVQRFRAEHDADTVFILTAVTPFSVSQDRAIIVTKQHTAQLVTCSGCTPRTALGQGLMRDITPRELTDFRAGLAQADSAWDDDALPPNVHDGITITIERATAQGYDRVRIVDPPPGSPHAQLIAAFSATFPELRAMLR